MCPRGLGSAIAKGRYSWTSKPNPTHIPIPNPISNPIYNRRGLL